MNRYEVITIPSDIDINNPYKYFRINQSWTSKVDYILNIHFGLFGSVWLKGDGIWPGFFPRIKSHSLRKSRLTHCLETLMVCTIHWTMRGNCTPITFLFF